MPPSHTPAMSHTGSAAPPAGTPTVLRWCAPAELDLSDYIRANQNIAIAQGPSQPLTLSELLVAQHPAIGPLRVFIGACFSDTFPPDRVGELRFSSYGVIGKGALDLSRAGLLRVVPAIYMAMPRLFSDGTWPVDVVFLQMAQDEQGRLTVGLTNDYIVQAARAARVVIAEVNAQAPWVHGAECPGDLRIDCAIRVDREPAGLASAGTLGPAEQAIAQHVASLVPNEATIQIGVGAIPDAILDALTGHRDLGVHSGLISDRVIDLIKKGVITNAAKPVNPGISITNVVLGTGAAKAHVDRNPAVRMPHSTWCHAPGTMIELDRFYAINSCIEVDLTGQVNAEVADGVYVGAIGGQPDFIRGALLAPRGRSIMVLPSTARKGTRSRVVATLSQGAVTTPRCDADLIVTEWGIAELRGVDFAERKRRMIAIADPNFRDELEKAAAAS